jgi:tetratricopeptide (TPR) repeat protein
MQFKGSTKTAPEIARALKVDALLEGSVRIIDDAGSIGSTVGKRVRINARLIYAGSDTQLWDRTFENVAADVLALQSNVANAVADGIKVKLATNSPRQAVNPQAYDTYLRGRYLWNKRTPEDLRRALDEFKRAISLDPTSAVAWSGLADAYLLLANQSEMAPLEAMPRAAEAARKAVELDPALAEARVSLATIAWSYDWQFDRAEQEYASALSLNPSYATGHAWHALYLAYSGQTAEAIREMQRAQMLDPLVLVNQINIARCYYFARQFDEAERLLRRVEEQEPSSWMVHAALGQTHLARGEYDRAIAQLTKARELSPASLRNLAVLGDAYGRSGRSAEALAMERELARLSQSRFVPAAYHALIHIGLGDHSRALSYLARSRAERSEWVTQLDVEPEFDPLRGDPRFGAVLSGITSRTHAIAR